MLSVEKGEVRVGLHVSLPETVKWRGVAGGDLSRTQLGRRVCERGDWRKPNDRPAARGANAGAPTGGEPAGETKSRGPTPTDHAGTPGALPGGGQSIPAPVLCTSSVLIRPGASPRSLRVGTIAPWEGSARPAIPNVRLRLSRFGPSPTQFVVGLSRHKSAFFPRNKRGFQLLRSLRCSSAPPTGTATDASTTTARSPPPGSRRHVLWFRLHYRGLSPPTSMPVGLALHRPTGTNAACGFLARPDGKSDRPAGESALSGRRCRFLGRLPRSGRSREGPAGTPRSLGYACSSLVN